ncbi:MAG: hypothetical protein JW867_00290 [Candidatus Omnitrophica bacterium]|nr:hypothetical protein [Candidatus Omnitrophota bacterium]
MRSWILRLVIIIVAATFFVRFIIWHAFYNRQKGQNLCGPGEKLACCSIYTEDDCYTGQDQVCLTGYELMCLQE